MDLETQIDPEQVNQQLLAWKRSYQVRKNIPYRFSPEWDESESTQRGEYERLQKLQHDAASLAHHG